MRVLELADGALPRQWGQSHGESFRGEIQSLADIRIYLCTRVGRFADAASVLQAAAAHLPVLEAYDADLYAELCGMAEGAGLSPAHLVVLNHYTDLRDLDPAEIDSAGPAGAPPAGKSDADRDGGCSILWAHTAEGTILAQTWDMHATAIPYVMMLRVPARGDWPETWLFTLTGCLGMTGLNQHGLGMAINNLHSTDARLGVVWPALVRRALRERDAVAARDVVLGAPIGSGHHYLVADASSAWGIETSGSLRRLVLEVSDAAGGEPAYVHTNHCLNPAVGAMSRVPQASTTYDRYERLRASVTSRPVTGVHDAWTRLGSQEGYPRSVCTNMATPENPHGAATCGAIAMALEHRSVWAQGGFIHNVAPELFTLGESA